MKALTLNEIEEVEKNFFPIAAVKEGMFSSVQFWIFRRLWSLIMAII